MASSRDLAFRVLCAEDDFPFQQVLRLALGRHGFEVVAASDGADALTQFKAHKGKFGSIISDHDMPKMNGLQLVRTVCEMRYKGRIIIMSGRLTIDDLRAYEPYPITGFFRKPFEVGMLAALLLQTE